MTFSLSFVYFRLQSALPCTRNNVTMTAEMMLDSSDKHYPSLLDAVNSIRKEGNLCNASLVVGDKKIPAHKCILVGGSDYFRSHFIGPLKEDKPEVDLSLVTDDVASTEAVVNFLYTGKIKVNEENLEAILKLSSYLLITQLRQFCMSYMLENVNLNTCLQYFLLAVEYDIQEVVDKFTQTIKSRFHDWLIFQENLLSVSPNQLLCLIKECNVFDHCKIIDALFFLLYWVEDGKSETHELLACDILDFVLAREKQLTDRVELHIYMDMYLEQISSMIESSEISPQLRSKLEKAVRRCSDISVKVAKRKTLRRLESRVQPCSEVPSGSESVLIVLSPKQRLKDLCKVIGEPVDMEEVADGESIYDVCAYIPRTHTWCYIGDGKAEYGSLMRLQTYISIFPWQFCCLSNTLCAVGSRFSFVHMLNMSDFSWKVIDLEPILPDPENSEKCGDKFLVCTDDTLYIILTARVFSNADSIFPIQIYFMCYRLTSENTWSHVFNTPRIDTQEEFEDLAAAISSVSNDIMIIHNSSQLYVFVADLSAKGSSAVEVQRLSSESTFARDQRPHLHIIENKNHFYVLGVEFEKQRVRISCRYRYQFRSTKLDVVEGCEVTVGKLPMHFSSLMYPCQFWETTYGKRSVWVFGGNAEHGSYIIEVTVDENGKLFQHSHKPPPFSCVSKMIVGQVSCEFLASLQHIIVYLTP